MLQKQFLMESRYLIVSDCIYIYCNNVTSFTIQTYGNVIKDINICNISVHTNIKNPHPHLANPLGRCVASVKYNQYPEKSILEVDMKCLMSQKNLILSIFIITK